MTDEREYKDAQFTIRLPSRVYKELQDACHDERIRISHYCLDLILVALEKHKDKKMKKGKKA